jgi:hypothetical protein
MSAHLLHEEVFGVDVASVLCSDRVLGCDKLGRSD